MYEISFSEDALGEFEELDGSVKKVFAKHIKKISNNPPKKFLGGGSGIAVEWVGQGKIACRVNESENEIRILHIFTTHKEYEAWYRMLL
ncbi:Uncharacterised protein [Candidatus Gugararchaeum adminiculabundum]|nr:Uncharacterised protein [Candidatus Gugararchaeum adminiculabundum]